MIDEQFSIKRPMNNIKTRPIRRNIKGSDVVLGIDVLPRGCLEAHFLKPWPCLGFLRLGLGLALVLEEVSWCALRVS